MADVTAGGQRIRVRTGGFAGIQAGIGDARDALAAAKTAVGTACDDARHCCGDSRIAGAVDEFGQLGRTAVESLDTIMDSIASALGRAAWVYHVMDIP